MRTWCSLLLLTLALATLVGCDFGPSQPSLPIEVRIGIVFDSGLPGESQRRAVEMALGELNGEETIRIVPIFEKSGGEPASAQRIFTTLVQERAVHAILGPTWSGEARAAHPIAQNAGVPVLAVSNAVGGISDVGEYIFRVSLSEGEVIVETINQVKEKLGLSRASLVYANNEAFSRAGAEVYRAELGRRGIEVVGEHLFKRDTEDFGRLLEKVKADVSEVIVVSALEADAWAIVQQARASAGIGPNIYILGGSAYSSPELLNKHKSNAEGLIFGTAWHPLSSDPTSRLFVEEYRKAYGTDPDLLAAQAYAGMTLLRSAISRAGLEGKSLQDARNAIRDSLKSGGTLPTPLGPFSVTDRRNPDHKPSVMVVREGKVEELK